MLDSPMYISSGAEPPRNKKSVALIVSVLINVLALFIIAHYEYSKLHSSVSSNKIKPIHEVSRGLSSVAHLKSNPISKFNFTEDLVSDLASGHNDQARYTGHAYPSESQENHDSDLLSLRKLFKLDVPIEEVGKEVDMNSFKDLDLHLVFFAYLNKGRNWWYSLETYSELIKKTGILDTAKSLHICISADTNDDWFVDFNTKEGPSDHTIGIQRLKNATDLMSYHLRDYLYKIHFDLTLGNVFEFPGIHKMWTLAQGLPDALGPKSIFLYFHAKGIAGHGQLTGSVQHIALYFQDVVIPWKYAMRGFAECPKMKVASRDYMNEGFCMGNYFFARGSFLWEMSKPKRSNDRYYYEHWLSLRDHNPVFPRNYTLNYAFVEFNESYRETWRYAPYLNGDSKNFWGINSEYRCTRSIEA